jgi:hypothetical protein
VSLRTPKPPSQAKCSAPGGKCPGLPTLQYGFFPAINVLEGFTRGGGASDVEGLKADTGIVGAEGDAFVSQVLESNPVTLDDSRSHLVIYSISFCHIWLFTLLARAHTRLLFNDRCCPFSTTQLHTRLPPSEVHTLHAQMRKQLMDESTSKGSAARTEKDTRIQIALCHTHGNRSAASSGLAPSPPLQSWDSPMVNNS